MSSNGSKVVMGPPFIQNGSGNPMALPELNAIIAAFRCACAHPAAHPFAHVSFTFCSRAVLYAVSTGPVGVGDGLNATDASIVLPTCDAAGSKRPTFSLSVSRFHFNHSLNAGF